MSQRIKVYQLAYFEKTPKLAKGRPVGFIQDLNDADGNFVAFTSLPRALRYRQHYFKLCGWLDDPSHTKHEREMNRRLRSQHRIVEMDLRILPDPEGPV